MKSYKIYPLIVIVLFIITACSEPVSESLQTDFSWQQIAATDTVQFTNLTAEAATYLWNFGDGTTSTEANPVHPFGRTGTFNVTLSATGDNQTGRVSKSVTIENICPVAIFMWEQIITTNSIQFTNYSKFGSTYHWDFGDGGTSTDIHPVHEYDSTGVYVVRLIASNDFDSDTVYQDVYINLMVVYKPNIYTYPETSLDLSVTLGFPQGGGVIASIPDYGSRWNVHVDTNGQIDGAYDYLFYESVQPDVWQKDRGWCVETGKLEQFFIDNMAQWNFTDREISDFTEYWVPRLKDQPYYVIYPQEKSRIESVISLDMLPAPDHVNRLFYLIKGNNEAVQLAEPSVNPFIRDGFSVVEWGVVL